MRRVDYADFDPAWIERRRAEYTEFGLLNRKHMRAPDGLSLLSDDARRAAQYHTAAGAPDEAITHLQLALAARVIEQYAYLTARDHVRFALPGSPEVTIPATRDIRHATRGDWETEAWLATILRDRRARDVICRLPTAALRAIPAVAPEYAFAAVDATRAFFAGAPATPRLLQRAIELTDPDLLGDDQEMIDWTLMIEAPALEVLFRIVARQQAQFDEALERALVLHRDFYTRVVPRTPEIARRARPEALLPIQLVGMAVAARQHGLALGVTSDYLPPFLLDLDRPSDVTSHIVEPLVFRPEQEPS